MSRTGNQHLESDSDAPWAKDLKKQLQNLENTWADVCVLIRDKKQKLENYISELQHFQVNKTSLFPVVIDCYEIFFVFFPILTPLKNYICMLFKFEINLFSSWLSIYIYLLSGVINFCNAAYYCLKYLNKSYFSLALSTIKFKISGTLHFLMLCLLLCSNNK